MSKGLVRNSEKLFFNADSRGLHTDLRGFGGFDGFTLIELMMVCVIIIVSSLIIVPKLINFMSTNDLEIEARKLRAKIRYAQQLAITKQITYRLEFDLSNESYDITYDSGGGSYTLVETIKLKDNIGIEATTFTSPADNTVGFDYFGAPSQAGDVVLKDARNSKTATIGIAAATGKVK